VAAGRDPIQRSQPLPQDSDWLSSFLPALRARGSRLIEIGCGPGLDAATLLAAGFDVTAFDRASIAHAHAMAPNAHLFRADLGRPLPLRAGVFDAALASLSLHYLPWAETVAAFAEIRRVLRPVAPFLFRVNATDDVHHGAGQGEEVERHLYTAAPGSWSDAKRFFDEDDVRRVVRGLFVIDRLTHQTIHRYEQPKQVWECLAQAC
jgi:SAM-dependent methyltransferase